MVTVSDGGWSTTVLAQGGPALSGVQVAMVGERALVAFCRQAAVGRDVLVMELSDGGWSGPETLAMGTQCEVTVALSNVGGLVAWTASTPTITVQASRKTGATWSAPVNEASPADAPQVAVNGAGTGVLAYRKTAGGPGNTVHAKRLVALVSQAEVFLQSSTERAGSMAAAVTTAGDGVVGWAQIGNGGGADWEIHTAWWRAGTLQSEVQLAQSTPRNTPIDVLAFGNGGAMSGASGLGAVTYAGTNGTDARVRVLTGTATNSTWQAAQTLGGAPPSQLAPVGSGVLLFGRTRSSGVPAIASVIARVSDPVTGVFGAEVAAESVTTDLSLVTLAGDGAGTGLLFALGAPVGSPGRLWSIFYDAGAAQFEAPLLVTEQAQPGTSVARTSQRRAVVAWIEGGTTLRVATR